MSGPLTPDVGARNMNAIRTCLLAIGFLALSFAPASAANRYVALDGAHISPFTNWVNAAKDIQSAINVAANNDTIFVSNGFYAISSTIRLNKKITLHSVNGAASTIINGGDTILCVEMTNGATIDGFTITRGRAWVGAGICSISGTIVNCEISFNTAYIETNPPPPFTWVLSGIGGGGRLRNTSMRNCIVVSNVAEYAAGGLECDGTILIKNTSILHNSAQEAGGLSYYEQSGRIILENCLIAKNYADNTVGGIEVSRANISHCTIVDNTAGLNLGGMYGDNDTTVINSIVYGNHSPSNSNFNYESDPWVIFTNSCTTPLPLGTNNILSAPQFTNPSLDDYRLSSFSPCIDAGTNVAGITTDLDSSPRVLDGNFDGVAVSDMGCYEFWSVYGNSTENGHMLIHWPGATNRKYSILTTTNLLLPFSPLATGITGKTPINTYTNPTLDAAGFFSVIME